MYEIRLKVHIIQRLSQNILNMHTLVSFKNMILLKDTSLNNNFCQAQSQFQVKLSLKTELALISVNPAPHPGKFIFQHFSVNVEQVRS